MQTRDTADLIFALTDVLELLHDSAGPYVQGRHCLVLFLEVPPQLILSNEFLGNPIVIASLLEIADDFGDLLNVLRSDLNLGGSLGLKVSQKLPLAIEDLGGHPLFGHNAHG